MIHRAREHALPTETGARQQVRDGCFEQRLGNLFPFRPATDEIARGAQTLLQGDELGSSAYLSDRLSGPVALLVRERAGSARVLGDG